MGNSYSVAQEEQEEAEFERLVRAVERAERGSASPELYDLEGQYHYVEAQGRPPRPEKVMAWFKSRRDNHAADPGTQSAPFGPALVQPAAPIFYPGTIVPEHTFPAPWHQAVYQPAPPSLTVQTPPQPGVIYPTIAPTIAILPRPGSVSELGIRSAATADSSESIVVTPSAAIRPSRDDKARDDDSYKHRDPSVGRPPPLAVPVAPVQPIPVQAEHDYTSTVNHASATVGHPQPMVRIT